MLGRAVLVLFFLSQISSSMPCSMGSDVIRLKLDNSKIRHFLSLKLDGNSLREKIFDQKNDVTYLVRGVAPADAKSAIVSDGAERGRVHGRERYGISDSSVVPAFLTRQRNGKMLDETEAYNVFRGAEFYANSGAALQRYSEWKGEKTSDARLATSVFPDEKGYLLVYALEPDTTFKYHPESNVGASHLEVELPQNAKLEGVVSLSDTTIEFDAGGSVMFTSQY